MTYKFQHVQLNKSSWYNVDPHQKIYHSLQIRSHNSQHHDREMSGEWIDYYTDYLTCDLWVFKHSDARKSFEKFCSLNMGNWSLQLNIIVGLIGVRCIKAYLTTTTSFNYLLRCRRLAFRTIRELFTSLIFSFKEGDCNLPDEKKYKQRVRLRLKLRSMICLGEKNSHQKNVKATLKAFTFL